MGKKSTTHEITEKENKTNGVINCNYKLEER